MRAAITALVALCFLESLTFVLLYLRSPWTTSAMGRHLMAFGVQFTVMFGLLLAGWAFAGPLPPTVWVVVLGALAVLLGWRIQLLVRAQRGGRPTDL